MSDDAPTAPRRPLARLGRRDITTVGDVFREPRWRRAIALILALVALLAFVIAVRWANRPQTPQPEVMSATKVLPPDDPSQLRANQDRLPRSQVSLQPGAAPVTTPTPTVLASTPDAAGPSAAPSVVPAPTAGFLDLFSPGGTMSLNEDVLFDFDSAALRPGAQEDLDDLAAALVATGRTEVDVVGYTDDVASQSYNLPLSRERAEAVAAFLRDRGVTANRLDVDWAGEADPAAPNTGIFGLDNPYGRQLNRRVEIRVPGSEAAAPLSLVLPSVTPFDGASALGGLFGDLADIGSALDRGVVAAAGPGTVTDDDGSTLTVSNARLDRDPESNEALDAVLLDVAYVNRSLQPVQLYEAGVWLVDDRANTYRLVPPLTNPSMAVPPGSELRGTLAFPALLPPGTQTMTLVTNADEPFELGRPLGRFFRDETAPVYVVTEIRLS